MADPASQAEPLDAPRHLVHPSGYDALHPSLQAEMDACMGSLPDAREALLGPDASRVCPPSRCGIYMHCMSMLCAGR